MHLPHKILSLPVVAGIMLAGSAVELAACDVPVYRYALERWQPDDYHLVVFQSGDLTEDPSKVLDTLRAAASDRGGHANFRLHIANPDGEMSESLRTLWNDAQPAEAPWMVLVYPESKAGDRVVWSGPFSSAGAGAILASPARRHIARRIADGQTAVWVLVESGDPERDDAAADVIAAELARAPELLTLPPEIAEQAPNLAGHLRIEFSLLRISRTDPAEQVLAAMLLRSEPDLLLAYADRAVAFPVFGRGRTLLAVVGDGITADNVLMGCRFLVGRCSCEVKDQNPGIDLLVDFPWQSEIGVSLVDLVELPEPMGPAATPMAADAGQDDAASPSPLLRNTLLALVLISLAAAVLALRAVKRARRNS